MDSTFINNTSKSSGGAINCWGINSILSNSIFTNNVAPNGGAVSWYVAGAMVNCEFVNSKWIKSNNIYAHENLEINGGKGIVDIIIDTNGTLSGTSIVVLNNETYYYPPSTNINFTK